MSDIKVYKEIVMIPVSDITPYWNNPRKNEKVVRALIKAIPIVGFNVPILVDKDKVIIKGHSRFNAAKELGLTEVPCIISDASDKQNKTDRVYDNAISELAEWDLDKLSLEVRDLDFNIQEIDDNIAKMNIYSDTNAENIYGESVTEDDFKLKTDDPKQDRLIKYVCPKCGEEILVSRNEVLSWK